MPEFKVRKSIARQFEAYIEAADAEAAEEIAEAEEGIEWNETTDERSDFVSYEVDDE